MDKNKEYEENLLQNKFLLENIQGGIVYSDFDPPFHLRYCTEGMAKLAGYTPEELIELTQIDIVVEEDLPALIDDVNRQFAMGDTFEVEYRLKRKDGSSLHVLDRAKVVLHDDGKKYIHCLLTDVSDLKKLEQKLRLNQLKYQIAIEQSGKAILEYDSETQIIHFSNNYKALFGYNPPTGTFQEILKSDWVVSEFKTKLSELIDILLTTSTTQAIELQINVAKSKKIWCSLFLIPVIENGNVFSIIGCLENINDTKNNINRLTELSEKDSLTGVYNRYAVEKFVKEQMKTIIDDYHMSALFILDIDYFKRINDDNGHTYGDKILIDLTKIVAKILPKGAILGRLGGDEFLIFATVKKDSNELEELSEKIINTVRTHFATYKKPITVSVGIALTSKRKDTFQKLYRNADKALYETKSKGKNGYTIFSHPMPTYTISKNNQK